MVNYFEKCDSINRNNNIASTPIFINKLQKQPRVTIAIPTYNRVCTLRFAILSALSQDYKDYEVIVVDNNPERNDDTEKLLMEYSKTSNLSYYKNEENIGLYGNWNRCFELSNSEWVTLLHDDDYYFPEYLSVMMAYINKYKSLDALSCKHVWWREDLHTSPINCIDRQTIPRPSGLVSIPRNAFLLSHPVGPVGMLFRKSRFESLGGYNPDFYPISDYVFHWNFFLRNNFKILNTYLVHYRIGINVSQKPETKELQEKSNFILRNEYIERNHLGWFAKKLVKAYYLEQMQEIKRLHPNYELDEDFKISRWNIFRFIERKYIYWYLRIRASFMSRFKTL